MKFILIGFCLWAALFVLGFFLGSLVDASPRTPRESCECRELRAIRMLLEQQSGVVCNEWRCLPAPTPTAGNGGPLP